jgi:signal transduction histidine kinase
MQAHPLSPTAARISTLPYSPMAHRPAASLPSTVLLPVPLGEPHSGRRRSVVRAETSVASHAGLAHDAGNLLGALQLYCDLLSAPGVLRPEHRHYAADLQLIAARSSTLIRRLLLHGTASSESEVLATQPDAAIGESAATPQDDPVAALRRLAPVLERIAAGAAQVSVAMPASLPAVQLPAEALERIAVNLVRNAAQALRSSRDTALEPGHICLTLDVFGSAVRLLVEDDGPGMPPAVAAAFLRPAPLPEGATRGLGHRIVHELASETGATLSVRVRPGRGTTFCLRWPIIASSDCSGVALEPFQRAAPTRFPPILTGGLPPC